MQPIVIHPGLPASHHADLIDAIITEEVRLPHRSRLRKGQRITEAEFPLLAELDRPIHAVRLDPGEVHENEAGQRLARMIMGPGLDARNPVQSRVNVIATAKGLLRVDPEAVHIINSHAPVGVFTVLDRQPVVPGKIVAGAKIATVAVDEAILDAIACELASRNQPVLEVKQYIPHRVGVVVTEGLAENLRNRFEASVRSKMTWYGSEIVRFAYVTNDAEAVSDAVNTLMAEGANLILTAGGNMMDPLDASIQSMPAIGASIVRLGAPAHPGSMFWLGEIAEPATPIVNLASCSMYSRATVADLVLPWVMSGESVLESDIAALGYGGLLDRDMGWRFPNYDLDTVDEPVEE